MGFKELPKKRKEQIQNTLFLMYVIISTCLVEYYSKH